MEENTEDQQPQRTYFVVDDELLYSQKGHFTPFNANLEEVASILNKQAELEKESKEYQAPVLKEMLNKIPEIDFLRTENKMLTEALRADETKLIAATTEIERLTAGIAELKKILSRDNNWVQAQESKTVWIETYDHLVETIADSITALLPSPVVPETTEKEEEHGN